MAVYQQIATRFGSLLSSEKIASRIAAARREFFQVGQPHQSNQRLVSSDEIERKLWKQLVGYVIEDVSPIEEAFNELWKHFSDPKNWRLYSDTADCWQQLIARGARVGITSNFDSRLHAIVKEFPTLGLAEFVFCSAEVGFRKPDPEFYRSVLDSMEQGGKVNKVFMVGDDRENDCLAPKRLGWDAVWLNRKKRVDVLTESSNDDSIAMLSELKI